MSLDRIGALRGQQEELAAFCRSLRPEEWSTASRCSGWTIKDTLSHMAAAAHGAFTPWMAKLMATKDVERNNDADVELRRDRPPAEVLAEYEKWSRRMATFLSVAQRPPLAKAPFKLGELGVYPMALVASAVVFDTHIHLHHDMAPALGRELAPPGGPTIAVMNEWVLEGIPRMCKAALSFMDRPVTITLDGPGGGSWAVVPQPGGKPGRIRPAPVDGSAAHITASAPEFAFWATQRRPWREQDVKIDGDEAYATRFLDAVKVV